MEISTYKYKVFCQFSRHFLITREKEVRVSKLLWISLLVLEPDPKNECEGSEQMVIYQNTKIAENHMGDESLWKSESLWDAEACAEKCFEMNGCVGFSFWPRDSPWVGCYPKSSTAGGISPGVGGHHGSGVISGILCDGSTSKDVMPDGGEIYIKGGYGKNSLL